MYANGQSVPSKALQPEFDSNSYIEAYNTLLSGMGTKMRDAGVYCRREDYGKGYTLVVFDLTSQIYVVFAWKQDLRNHCLKGLMC